MEQNAHKNICWILHLGDTLYQWQFKAFAFFFGKILVMYWRSVLFVYQFRFFCLVCFLFCRWLQGVVLWKWEARGAKRWPSWRHWRITRSSARTANSTEYALTKYKTIHHHCQFALFHLKTWYIKFHQFLSFLHRSAFWNTRPMKLGWTDKPSQARFT